MSFIEQDNNNSLDCHQCKRNLEIKIYKISAKGLNPGLLKTQTLPPGGRCNPRMDPLPDIQMGRKHGPISAWPHVELIFYIYIYFFLVAKNNIYKIGKIAKYDSKLDFNPKSIPNLNQMQK